MKTDYTREELISICEQAIVPVDKWGNRDTPHAQERVGLCWVLLSAGCKFVLDGSATDQETIWFEISWPSFYDMEEGEGFCSQNETFYLPTPERLERKKGGDWY